jgi:hypothetical protein
MLAHQGVFFCDLIAFIALQMAEEHTLLQHRQD